MAEVRVGLGAELFAPKRRFMLADGFKCVEYCGKRERVSPGVAGLGRARSVLS